MNCVMRSFIILSLFLLLVLHASLAVLGLVHGKQVFLDLALSSGSEWEVTDWGPLRNIRRRLNFGRLNFQKTLG